MDTEPSNSTSPRSTKFWVWTGRLAVVVGLAWAVIQLVTWIWPNGPKLEVKANTYDFALPPDIQNGLKAADSFPDNDSLVVAITNDFELQVTNIARAQKIASTIKATLDSVKFTREDFLPIRQASTGFNRWNHYTLVTIKNNGNRPAEQMVLALEDAQALAVITYDSKTKVEKVFGPLELGALRPGGEISVSIWSGISPLPYGARAVVSHSGGTIKVQTPEILYGYGGQVGSFASFAIQHPVFIIALALIGIWLNTVITSRLNRLFDTDKSSSPVEKSAENPTILKPTDD